MDVVCPGCSRSYARKRFTQGRTFFCACGAQVVGPRVRIRGDVPPRFIADAMLGGLARRLRILGLDTLYDPALDDDKLVARAFADDRVVLTCDRRLARDWNVDGIVCLTGDTTDEQLVELATIVPIGEHLHLFTRCSFCNTELAVASRAEVEMLVPPGVLAMHRTFVRCPSCGRIYWEGSHTSRMRRQLRRLLAKHADAFIAAKGTPARP